MVKRENLLVIAGLFWLFAGVNVAGIGVRSFFSVEVGAWPWMLAVMAVVFVAFGLMFGRCRASTPRASWRTRAIR